MAGNKRKTWKEALAQEQPLLLPCAHDALSARLIERAGFTAYSIGGFALVGSRYGIPDIGLAAFGEISAGIRDIMAATGLPVLVDGDTGYGDVKNVAHTIEGYEAMGASAIFIEDQVAPKRCGHMAGKDVIAGRADGGEDQGRGRRAKEQGLLHHRADRRARRARPRRGAAPRRDVSQRRRRRHLHRGAADRRGAGAGRPHVQRRAADRQHAGGRRPDAGAAAGAVERDGLRHGGLSDHADFPRGAHDRAGARRHQGRQDARRQRRRRLRRVEGHHQLQRMGAHRGHSTAAPGGMHEARDRVAGAGLERRRADERPCAEGAARGRRPERALLPAAHRHRPARLLQGRGPRRRNLRSRRRRQGAAGADRRQRRRGDRRVRPHHPDAGQGPADHGGGSARPVSGLRGGEGRPQAPPRSRARPTSRA